MNPHYLTPTELRIAAAKADGWKDFDGEDGALMGHIMGSDGWLRWDMVPEYITETDAIRAAIAKCTPEEQVEIAKELMSLIWKREIKDRNFYAIDSIVAIIVHPDLAKLLTIAFLRVVSPDVFAGRE